MSGSLPVIFSRFSRIRHLLDRSGLKTSAVVFDQKTTDGTQMEELKANPYYEKYAGKIASVQQTSPEEFLSRLESRNQKPGKRKSVDERPWSGIGRPKPDLTQSFIKQKQLDSVMKMELIKDKNADEIAKIWHDYHAKQDKISAIIPRDTYCKIMERALKFPLFLYPVPRSEGFEFIVAQFANQECHFTTLVNYQAYKENAPECLAITHYPDVMDEKGIVLMHGEFNKDVLNASEAQCLANQLQLYYTAGESERKYQLLQTFSVKPDAFRHKDLIAELRTAAFLGQ